MAEKKNTPLQELLAFIKGEDLGYFYDPEGAIYKIQKKAESLLPKEKEFAREVFVFGMNRAEHNLTTHHSEESRLHSEKTYPPFDLYYKQYEP